MLRKKSLLESSLLKNSLKGPAYLSKLIVVFKILSEKFQSNSRSLRGGASLDIKGFSALLMRNIGDFIWGKYRLLLKILC